MTIGRRLFVILGSIAITACVRPSEMSSEQLASANLILANGTPAGTVQLLAKGEQLSLTIAISGILDGPHGFHLHTAGKCKGPDFTSAGGHLNPMGKGHGTLSPGGSHLGDLPNIEIIDNHLASAATIKLSGPRTKVLQWLFDTDGTAVVVHSGADDYLTNPSGNAGPRVACGILKQS